MIIEGVCQITKTNTNNKLLIFIPIYIIAYYIAISFYEDKVYISNFLNSIFSVLGCVVALTALFNVYNKSKGDEKYFWLFFFLGIVSYSIGEAIYFYYELILKVEVSSPSICDLFYLLQYPFLLAGVLYIVSKKHSGYFSVRLLFDILLVVIIFLTFTWHYFMQYILVQEGMNKLLAFILVAHPIGDFGVLMAIIFLTIIPDRIFSRRVVAIATLGLTLEVITDLLYLYVITFNTVFNVALFEPLWMLSILLIALAGQLYIDTENEPLRENRKYTPYINLLIPYICVIAMFMVVIKIMEKNLFFMGFMITVILVIIRQIFTIIENNNLMKLLQKSYEELEIKKLELEAANKELLKFGVIKDKESKTDFLTGLYNRRYMDEGLKELIEKCKISLSKNSILMIDIDHFKKINDTYGHQIGDFVLKQVSEIMKESLRGSDILIRFGGEEFLSLLTDTDIDSAKMIAERLRKKVEKGIFVADYMEIPVTISIGIAEIGDVKVEEDFMSKVEKADKALYDAKMAGRNRIAVNVE